LQITFLGTGTSQGVPVIGCDCIVCRSDDPRDNRSRASILISNLGKNIVVDAGPDFRTQMLNNKVDSLDAVLITHEHNDHTAGLDDLRPFIFRQRKEMPLFVTDSVNTALRKRFEYAFSNDPYPGAPRLITNEIKHGTNFNVAGIEILPIEVMHGSLPVLAFRIGSFTYVTDANLISEDSLALMKKKHYSHYNLEEALEIISIVKPEKCYLTHISHAMGRTTDWESTLPPNVFPAVDGLSINVNK